MLSGVMLSDIYAKGRSCTNMLALYADCRHSECC
jgi:hypothetical protein